MSWPYLFLSNSDFWRWFTSHSSWIFFKLELENWRSGVIPAMPPRWCWLEFQMLVSLPLPTLCTKLGELVLQVQILHCTEFEFSWAVDPRIAWMNIDCYLSNYKEFLFVTFWRTAHLTEKGKLKHAIVSSQPSETKDISSLKVCHSSPWHCSRWWSCLAILGLLTQLLRWLIKFLH